MIANYAVMITLRCISFSLPYGSGSFLHLFTYVCYGEQAPFSVTCREGTALTASSILAYRKALQGCYCGFSSCLNPERQCIFGCPSI